MCFHRPLNGMSHSMRDRRGCFSYLGNGLGLLLGFGLCSELLLHLESDRVRVLPGERPLDCTRSGTAFQDCSPYQPSIHDLRHSFAVHQLTEWYRKGNDAQALLPALSTYLGHVELHSTQRYLTMMPELLGEANRGFERYVCGDSDE
jgi:hypothetical protein